eukprot:GFYU01004370.1.p1 GENE.GFYU01004370.1~~GFYU01004370.1.p1  ORF type:complete len:920 (-),score=219.60 GFYU01004370.1:24-2438(-)
MASKAVVALDQSVPAVVENETDLNLYMSSLRALVVSGSDGDTEALKASKVKVLQKIVTSTDASVVTPGSIGELTSTLDAIDSNGQSESTSLIAVMTEKMVRPGASTSTTIETKSARVFASILNAPVRRRMQSTSAATWTATSSTAGTFVSVEWANNPGVFSTRVVKDGVEIAPATFAMTATMQTAQQPVCTVTTAAGTDTVCTSAVGADASTWKCTCSTVGDMRVTYQINTSSSAQTGSATTDRTTPASVAAVLCVLVLASAVYTLQKQSTAHNAISGPFVCPYVKHGDVVESLNDVLAIVFLVIEGLQMISLAAFGSGLAVRDILAYVVVDFLSFQSSVYIFAGVTALSLLSCLVTFGIERSDTTLTRVLYAPGVYGILQIVFIPTMFNLSKAVRSAQLLGGALGVVGIILFVLYTYVHISSSRYQQEYARCFRGLHLVYHEQFLLLTSAVKAVWCVVLNISVQHNVAAVVSSCVLTLILSMLTIHTRPSVAMPESSLFSSNTLAGLWRRVSYLLPMATAFCALWQVTTDDAVTPMIALVSIWSVFILDGIYSSAPLKLVSRLDSELRKMGLSESQITDFSDDEEAYHSGTASENEITLTQALHSPSSGSLQSRGDSSIFSSPITTARSPLNTNRTMSDMSDLMTPTTVHTSRSRTRARSRSRSGSSARSHMSRAERRVCCGIFYMDRARSVPLVLSILVSMIARHPAQATDVFTVSRRRSGSDVTMHTMSTTASEASILLSSPGGTRAALSTDRGSISTFAGRSLKRRTSSGVSAGSWRSSMASSPQIHSVRTQRSGRSQKE